MRLHHPAHRCWWLLPRGPDQSYTSQFRISLNAITRVGYSPEDIGSHDEYTSKHLWGHVDSIAFAFKLGDGVWEGECPAKSRLLENLSGSHAGPSAR